MEPADFAPRCRSSLLPRETCNTKIPMVSRPEPEMAIDVVGNPARGCGSPRPWGPIPRAGPPDHEVLATDRAGWIHSPAGSPAERAGKRRAPAPVRGPGGTSRRPHMVSEVLPFPPAATAILPHSHRCQHGAYNAAWLGSAPAPVNRISHARDLRHPRLNAAYSEHKSLRLQSRGFLALEHDPGRLMRSAGRTSSGGRPPRLAYPDNEAISALLCSKGIGKA